MIRKIINFAFASYLPEIQLANSRSDCWENQVASPCLTALPECQNQVFTFFFISWQKSANVHFLSQILFCESITFSKRKSNLPSSGMGTSSLMASLSMYRSLRSSSSQRLTSPTNFLWKTDTSGFKSTNWKKNILKKLVNKKTIKNEFNDCFNSYGSYIDAQQLDGWGELEF